MLLKVVFPNGRSSLYRPMEELDFNPVGFRVLVPLKSGKGATGVVVKTLPDNSEGSFPYIDSFPDRYPVVNPPVIELLKDILIEYITTLGESLFSLIPPWADWYQETFVVAVDKNPVGLPKSAQFLMEELKKKGRVPYERFVKKFDPKVIRFLEKHHLIRLETKWIAPKVEEEFYRLKIKDREEILRRIKRASKQRKEEVLKLLNLFEYVDLPSKEELKEEGISTKTLKFLENKGILEKVVTNLPPFKSFELNQTLPHIQEMAPPSKRELYENYALEQRLNKVIRIANWCLAENRDLLLVVPNFELFEFYRKELYHHFGDRLVAYHHSLPQKEAIKNWFWAAEPFGKIVLTTPQRAFLPLYNLGAVVLEDEFSAGYKQWKAPYLNLKRLLFKYSELLKVPLIVFSNPPSLELKLLSKIFKVEKAKKELKKLLLETKAPFEETALLELLKGERALVLVPKKGYSNLYCKKCGKLLECPSCEALLYRDIDGSVRCPLCSYKTQAIECPQCGEKTVPFGYGAQRVKEILSSIEGKFEVLTHPKEIKESYPIVVVLFADNILSLPDFRKGEELFAYLKKAQNLTAEGGIFILNTTLTDHHAVRAVLSNSDQLFYENETEYRKLLELPPFSRLYLVALNLKEENETLVKNLYKELKTKFLNLPVEVEFSKAPTFKLRKKYRYQILVKVPLRVDKESLKKLSEVLRNIKNRYKFVSVIPNPRSLL